MAIDKQVNVIISSVDKYSAGLSAFSGSWSVVLGGILAAEIALIAVSAAMAKFTYSMGSEFVASAADFHDAIFNVEAVAQSFGTSSSEIAAILKDLTIEFPLTGEAAGSAMQLIAQMGYGGEQQLRSMSEAAIELSIATGTDMNVAAKAMMSTMNMFGLEVDDTERIMNLFAAAAFSSAASVDDMSTAMTYAGPIAALTGQEVEQTAAMLALLVDNGLEASTAGTTLRMALSKLLTETEKGTAALAKYGLTYDDVNPSVNSLSDIIGKFEGQTLAAEDAVALFGVRATSIALVINDGEEAFIAYTDSITGTTAATDAMEKKMETWSVVSDQLDGSLDVLKATIGKDLLGAVINLIGKDSETGIRGIVNQIQALEEETNKIGGPMVEAFNLLKESASEMFTDAFGDAEGFYDWLGNISTLLSTNMVIIGEWATAWASIFIDSTSDQDSLITFLEIINGAFTALSLTVAIVHDMFVGLWAAGEYGLALLTDGWRIFELALLAGVETILVALDKVPWVDMTEELEGVRSKMEEVEIKILEAFDTDPPKFWTDNVIEGSANATIAIGKMKSAAGEFNDEISLTPEKVEKLEDGFDVVEGKIVKAEKATGDWNLTVEETERLMENLGQDVDVMTNLKLPEWAQGMEDIFDLTKINREETEKLANEYGITADNVKSIRDNYELVEGYLIKIGDEAEIWHEGTKLQNWEIKEILEETQKLETSTEGVADAAKKTAEELSDLAKQELTLETEKFKSDLKLIEIDVEASHDLIKTKLEWEAQLEIASLESDAKIVEAIFGSIADSVQSSADAASSMFDSLAGASDLTGSEFYTLSKLLEDQMEVQKDLADSQIKLTNAQAVLLEAQADSIRTDGVKINVTIQGNTAGWLSGLTESLLEEIFVQAEIEGFQCFGV
ncbi:hypothetical protein LCGC14_1030810 [marine sediment metagenome]|uniref:Phage tail tape measure protein domain-containing protein n=1 Tax=marine sediment metagenome TaxID=412755 RepID=A0A0F9NGD6_9ZZZZ